MTPGRRPLAGLILLTFIGVAIVAGAPTASGAPPAKAVKPVIGQPVAVPAKPLAGKPFVVTFKVTRSDNGKPLTAGTITADPSVAGKTIPHAQSLTRGVARVSFVVPATAGGKLLKVKVIVTVGAASATKITSFPIPQVPKLSIGDVQAAEGSSGTTTLSFPVTLSASTTQTVSVSYATSDGTATAPDDYASASGTLTFRPGETTKTIDVAIVADTAVEPDEMLTVTLSSPVNATIADNSATGLIQNDDLPAQPGRYTGTTSQNELFQFDVTADGASITGLTSGQINESCSPGGTISGGQLNLGSTPVPIAKDGSFTIDTTSKGTVSGGGATAEATARLVITGRFTAGAATGTLLETLSFTLSGTPFSCSSGNQTWSVTRTG